MEPAAGHLRGEHFDMVLTNRGSFILYFAGGRRPLPARIMRSTAFRMRRVISRFEAASTAFKSARSSSGVLGLRPMPHKLG
jgi:hypothetical protein